MIAERQISSENVTVYEFKKGEEETAKPVFLSERGLFTEGLPTFMSHSNEEFEALEKALLKHEKTNDA
jgi:hypothetical protein